MRLSRLNNRFFSADTGTGGGSVAGDVEAVEKSYDDTILTTADEAPAGSVNTEQIKNEAIAGVLQSLGVSSLDEAQAGLKAWADYQEGQKTELERLQSNFENSQKSIAERDGVIADLQAQLAASQLGVPADNVADVVTLANGLVGDNADVGQAIQAVLDKYPHFKIGGAVVEDGKPSFVAQTKQKQETTEDAFLKALGLKG